MDTDYLTPMAYEVTVRADIILDVLKSEIYAYYGKNISDIPKPFTLVENLEKKSGSLGYPARASSRQ
jgi:hypothetical protein